MTCNCTSYNTGIGVEPNKILEVPDEILRFTDGRKTVCIDACIADVISSIWSRGLPTLNSCCGHNMSAPEIVIPENMSPLDYLIALREVDPKRFWNVSRWERVIYSTEVERG